MPTPPLHRISLKPHTHQHMYPQAAWIEAEKGAARQAEGRAADLAAREARLAAKEEALSAQQQVHGVVGV